MLSRNTFLILTAIAVLSFPLVSRSEMSSTHYTIYADSIDLGGVLSTSTSYSLQGTSGEVAVGTATSSSYEIRSGFQGMERGSLSILINNSSLDMGNLSNASVSSVATTVTVTADSTTGYTLSIGSVSGTAIAAVTDGTVSAGSEEYGLSASGADSVVSGDVAVAANSVLASTSTPAINRQTSLTFKASRTAGSAEGTYNQTIVLSVSANL